jgi:hypothetical protein
LGACLTRDVTGFAGLVTSVGTIGTFADADSVVAESCLAGSAVGGTSRTSYTLCVAVETVLVREIFATRTALLAHSTDGDSRTLGVATVVVVDETRSARCTELGRPSASKTCLIAGETTAAGIESAIRAVLNTRVTQQDEWWPTTGTSSIISAGLATRTTSSALGVFGVEVVWTHCQT